MRVGKVYDPYVSESVESEFSAGASAEAGVSGRTQFKDNVDSAEQHPGYREGDLQRGEADRLDGAPPELEHQVLLRQLGYE